MFIILPKSEKKGLSVKHIILACILTGLKHTQKATTIYCSGSYNLLRKRASQQIVGYGVLEGFTIN